MEKISVIVISFNEEKNIRECLNSLNSQDFNKNDYEILVVDASIDNTKEIIKEFKDVRLINSEKKAYGYQRNLGIKNSRYNLIAFTDADCAAPSDWLSNLVNNLEECSCLGGSVKYPNNTRLIGRAITALGFPAGGSLGIENFGNISTCNSIFRKEVFNKSGLFNEELIFGGEDSELMERVKKNNFKIKLTNNCFVYHKPRNFIDFLKWNFKRGAARYHLYKNLSHLFMPLSVVVYPFTKKFRLLLKNRNKIGLNIISLFTIVIFLFFLRQLFMSFGWAYGFRQSIRK